MSSTAEEPKTEVVRASEMREKVFQRIWDIRTGQQRKDARAQYEKDLHAYEKKRGKREEVEISSDTLDDNYPAVDCNGGRIGVLRTQTAVGYFTMKDSRPQFHLRPEAPRNQDDPPPACMWQRRERVNGVLRASRLTGLLANATYNRDIRPERVEEYTLEMEAGRWEDLFSDPIAITIEGEVLNGQHRLAAIWDCLYDNIGSEYIPRTRGMGTDPAFLVIWGVDPQEALYADGSRRTAVDEKTIAVKLVKKQAA